MRSLQILWKMAAAGDDKAMKKLMSESGQEIDFLCTALCSDSAVRESSCSESMDSISSAAAGCSSYEEFSSFVRRKTAEICLHNMGDRIFVDNIPEQAILLSGNKDMISLPAEVLTDYYAVNEVMQLIYYSTRGYEYNIFILYYFSGYTLKEAAAVYRISEADAGIILANTIARIRHSLSTFRPDDKKTEISFSSLLNAASTLKPPPEKKHGSLRSGIPFYKTGVGKLVTVGVFAVILTAACAAFLIPFINSPGRSRTGIRPDYPHIDGHEKNDIVRRTDDPAISESLYMDLVCDEVCSSSLLGIDTAGFVHDSEQVTVFQIIVTNSTSDMINSTDLQVSFSDGTDNNYVNGKRYFTYNVFDIDERTYLVEIFAPGTYSPDQFKVDMYRSGIPDSSYIIPTKIKTPDDLDSNLIANNNVGRSASLHSIIRILSGDKAYYYYIENAYVQITDETDEDVTEEATLLMIPVGGVTDADNQQFFDFVTDPDALKKHSDIIQNVTVIRADERTDELPPYISVVSFRIHGELKAGNADIDELENALNGYFSYKNDTIRIDPIRF